MFEIKNLSSALPERKLKNFYIKIDKPEIHGILCSSFSWMDELLDIFSGDIPIEEGAILIDGESIIKKNGLSHIKLVVGSNGLYKDISVLENLYIAEKKGVFYSKIKCAEKYGRLFRELGIDIDLKKKADQLSRREKKLIELLRCYIMEAKVVILYEFESNLSSRIYPEINRVLNFFKKNDIKILYLTSKWEEALKICDSISVVYNGKTVSTFSKEQIRNNPRELYYSMQGEDGLIERTLNKDEQEQINNLEMLQESIEIIKEGQDRNVYLLKYVEKLKNHFSADSSMIYLVDASSDGTYKVVSQNYSKEEPYILGSDAIRNFIREDFFYINCNNGDFNSYFKNGQNDSKTVMGCSIQLYNNIKILLQISYTNYYVYSSKDKHYLSAACREVAILVENSRLAGESILLQESHHRIKNNLQLVLSLLEMEKGTIFDRVKNVDAANTLTNIIDGTIYRMKSIASIHNILAHNSSINSVVSITSVMDQLSELYRTKAEISIKVEDFHISNKRATSLILVLNELISNGVKHGESVNKLIHINLQIKVNNKEICVTYHDDGKGFPKNFDLEKDGGIGTLILTSIIKNEFKGTIECYNDYGACISICFPNRNLNDMELKGIRY